VFELKAEFIKEEIYEIVKSLGVDYSQGYFMGKLALTLE